MTIKYSQYAQRPYLTIGTALTTSGTVVAPTSNGDRIILQHMDYWLQVPSGTVTVGLLLGSGSVPPMPLTAACPTMGVPAYTLAQNTGITATLTGTGTVCFFGTYLIASDA
jgi:hypothetical protein